MKLLAKQILGADGKPISLTPQEQNLCNFNQRWVNSLGAEIDITTLTTLIKKVTDQKFFTLAPADFIPIDVGNGAWGTKLTTYRSFSLGDDFGTGLINTGRNNAKLASVNAGVDAVDMKINNWAKEINWNLFDLQQSLAAGSWDYVEALERSRKTNWDLGIQDVAFLGLPGDSSCLGLYNQAVTPNEDVITKALKEMTATEITVFCKTVLDAYRTRCVRTAMPTHFVIPESDFLGLSTPINPDYAVLTRYDLIMKTFVDMTGNKSFEVKACAYGDAAYSGLEVQRYILYRYDDSSIRMDLPIDYTNTTQNTIQGFNYQNVGYGQFTGVGLYRPLEFMYFDY